MNILVLGADGNAGRNYAKCFIGNDVKLIGTSLNKYQTYIANWVYDEIKYFDEPYKAHNFAAASVISDIDFVHAQPEEEVDFLCQSELKNFGYGKDWDQRKTFKNKLSIQNLLNVPAKNYVTMSQKTFDEFKEMGNGKVWVRSNQGAGSKNALPVVTYDDLKHWIKYLLNSNKITHGNQMIVSPFFPGEEYAVQQFYINGELYHSQARERVEYFFGKQMISGQSSTPSVARTSNDPDVYAYANRVVETITQYLDTVPDGIYCIDMKKDANGLLQVTEVNYGRYFTTVDFFATLGMNTPAAEIEWAVNGKLPEKKIASIDEGYLWIRGLDYGPTLIKE